MSENNFEAIKNADPTLMNGEAKCPVSHGSRDHIQTRKQTRMVARSSYLNILHQHDHKTNNG